MRAREPLEERQGKEWTCRKILARIGTGLARRAESQRECF